MKKLWLISTLSLSVILLAGCMDKAQENVETEIIDEENIVIEEQENIEEEIIEEEIEEEFIDWEKWSLMAFNWKEVDWNYKMIIKDNEEISVKFCNGIWWTVNFGWDYEWTITASLVQTEMACEWESMDLENAFKIDWATYSKMPDEDGWSTMIITTTNWDKFYWRTIMN